MKMPLSWTIGDATRLGSVSSACTFITHHRTLATLAKRAGRERTSVQEFSVVDGQVRRDTDADARRQW